MSNSTTKQRIGCCTTIRESPPFARDEEVATAHPPRDATIWRISLSPGKAFKLLCDIGKLYPVAGRRPRVGGMLERDGAITICLWPSVDPDSALLLLLLSYGAARLIDASRWEGEAWIAGDLLAKVLAVLAHRDHWRMSPVPRLADERPAYLLSLPRQVLP